MIAEVRTNVAHTQAPTAGPEVGRMGVGCFVKGRHLQKKATLSHSPLLLTQSKGHKHFLELASSKRSVRKIKCIPNLRPHTLQSNCFKRTILHLCS